MTTTASDVALYYDELHRWTARDQGFQTFSGFGHDSIHRFLIDADSGAFSPLTIYKHVDRHLPTHEPLRGLDAGCGYGGTAFRYLETHGGRWTGVTISQQQWRCATAIAQARGVAGAIDFHLASYDAPLPGRYNVIVGIESLIHTADPMATVGNLAAALDPGGRLVVVDDMPVEAPPPGDAVLLDEFRRAWRCPVAPTAAAWSAVATAAGLSPIAEHDLSHLLKPRAEPDLDAALDHLTSLRAEKTRQGFGRLSDAEIGGLHLERLTRRGSMRYVMLVFERR
jgi:SAM-dependent methyltransferase